MSSDVIEALKIPSRSAPPPPKPINTNGVLARNSAIAFGLPKPPEKPTSRADRCIYQSVPRSRSTSDIAGKKPPPRPPPPRLPPMPSSNNTQQKLQTIKIKLPGFKSRKKGYQYNNKPHVSTWRASNNTNKSNPLVGSLIDLKSPTNSNVNDGWSSDDSSVDSFDSDSGGPSLTENQNDYSRAWSGSQVESGFEDDFDRLSTPGSSDPWSDPKSDPFSPQRRSVPVPLFGKFDISNDDPKMRKPFALSTPGQSRPTVIRPILPSPALKITASVNKDEELINGSPPMPTIPPPPLPPEALEVLAHGPSLPPRPIKSFELPTEKEKPHCIALYDYSGDHSEDLSFKANDEIFLKRKVNEEWLEGEVNGRNGIFPSCYVKIEVPIADESELYSGDASQMIVLFDYHAQSWDDLELKEGDLIRLIGKVDNNWLYGECNGKQGQFPSNYTAEYLLS